MNKGELVDAVAAKANVTKKQADKIHWSLTQRDVNSIELLMPLWSWFYRYYFQVKTDGWHHIPTEGKVLLVGSHNGGMASPDLVMMMYDWFSRFGTERLVYGLMHPAAWKLIRYADDFVILHNDITVVQRCQQTIAEWLEGMGLELKPSKTRLTHTLDKYEDNEPGFNFLGFNVRQFPAGKHTSGRDSKKSLLGFKTIITPNSQKLKIHYEKIVSTINAHKSAPQKALIRKLNPMIRGWANYYSTVVSNKSYSQLDYLMYKKLRVWAKHRHRNKTPKWIAKKYWQSIGGDNWVFATRQEGKNPMWLLKHSRTPIVRHVKVRGEASPFDGNLIYWSSRMGTHPEATIRMSTLLKKQKGKCNHCGLYFREEDVMEIDHIIPKILGGKDEYKNLHILHRHCHDTKTADDGSVAGTHDKRQIIEEPDEVKVSCPVL